VCKNMSIESDFDSNFLYNKQWSLPTEAPDQMQVDPQTTLTRLG
jgi:hypothetical protein